MNTSLSVLSQNSGLQFREFKGTAILKSDLHLMLPLAVSFSRTYNCVLYGGQTANPYIYGLQTIRNPTTDLDFICTIDSIREIVRNERDMYYHPEYDIIFCYRNNIPITFTVVHIHDCLVGPDVIATAETVMTESGPVLCANREYSIVLKMRRSEDCLLHKRRIFGKDALDIINIIAGAAVRHIALDYDLIANLFRTHVVDDSAAAETLFQDIAHYESHLPNDALDLFHANWSIFQDAVLGALS